MLPPIKLCPSKLDRQKADDHKHVPKAKTLTPIRLCVSKSDQQKANKQKHVPKAKKRNWLDLPSDLTSNILQRIGAVDILENAQKVCTTWRKISKDPTMWRVIHLCYSPGSHTRPQLRDMCMRAVDRSQGQLVDITLVDFANDDVLKYISDRASNLRRLEIAYWYSNKDETWTEAFKKFSSLEELSLHQTGLSEYSVETLGRHCPLLKILKVNIDPPQHVDEVSWDTLAKAIAKNLPELRHLELIGDGLSNIGLKAILDGCRHLESLDMRMCFNLDLQADADLEKRCSRQIKHLKLPPASLDGYPYIWEYDSYDGGCPFADLCAHMCSECGHNQSDSDDHGFTEYYSDYHGFTDFFMDYYSL